MEENQSKRDGNAAQKQEKPEEKNSLKDNVTLVEDFFGYFYDASGKPQKVLRYTWKNVNRITVQVINYGARIVSIKFPDRKGVLDDIVLGFDDLAGYIFYQKYYIGATIGRMTNVIKDSTFRIGKNNYSVEPNTPEGHQRNGGRVGLDQKVWDTHIEGKKVIMGCISRHCEEGYPGSLMVTVAFELSERNEFKIDMEAYTTMPTVINLSNLMYFNLAGHYTGPDEIYKHILTLNCNCFTKQEENGMCTGEIMNVVHTQNDFQIPTTLGKVMGIVAKDGYNQNFCINRGVGQGGCFVARVLHPPSGRLIELYSNQYGVQFDTANCFGYGQVLSIEDITSHESVKRESSVETPDGLLKLLDSIYEKLMDTLKEQDESDTNYPEFRQFLQMLQRSTRAIELHSNENLVDFICDDEEALQKIATSPQQLNFMKMVRESMKDDTHECHKAWLSNVVDRIIQHSEYLQSDANEEEKREFDIDKIILPPTPPSSPRTDFRPPDVKEKQKSNPKNVIPSFYKSVDHIIGKSRRVYTMHGGIALQTQNYPNCANIDSFPNCVLKPGEKYNHSIIYKFWIRSGNPSRWMKRNLHEMAQIKKTT